MLQNGVATPSVLAIGLVFILEDYTTDLCHTIRPGLRHAKLCVPH
jgi:hypothetical protein